MCTYDALVTGKISSNIHKQWNKRKETVVARPYFSLEGKNDLCLWLSKEAMHDSHPKHTHSRVHMHAHFGQRLIE